MQLSLCLNGAQGGMYSTCIIECKNNTPPASGAQCQVQTNRSERKFIAILNFCSVIRMFRLSGQPRRGILRLSLCCNRRCTAAFQPSVRRFMNTSATKIVATIGPASENMPMLQHVVDAGLKIMRINFSHATFEEADLRTRNLRTVHALAVNRRRSSHVYVL